MFSHYTLWFFFILGKRLCIGSLDQVQSLTQLSLADCRLVPCLSLVLLIYLQFRSSLDSLVNFNQTCYWQKRKFGQSGYQFVQLNGLTVSQWPTRLKNEEFLVVSVDTVIKYVLTCSTLHWFCLGKQF